VNTNPTVTSALGAVARVLALGACLVLAACGRSQNWQGSAAYVTIGGTVAGLSGTVVLQDNGQDNLTITGNGSFTFGLSIANGAAYAATILTQPNGQACSVTNGSGTAGGNVTSIQVACRSFVSIGGTVSGLTGGTVVLVNNGGNALATATNGAFTFTASIPPGSAYAVTVKTPPAGAACFTSNSSGTASSNVTNVAVVCAPFTLRPLPAVYTTGKAINYGPYRDGGPSAGEVPSDANILQDLGLLNSAGFNLIRLFGGDPVHDKILKLAAANYPALKFQVGLTLQGLATPAACTGTDAVNAYNSGEIGAAIAFANTYPNVVAVSVGNETSFYSRYMPVTCLANYITTVRSQVKQPVTADDDYTLYAGLTAGGGDRIAERPDAILTLIDFVSIHIYPFSNPALWDSLQTGTPAGPARAAAMMNASLAWTKSQYQAVANYLYRGNSGSTTSIGASLPIVIGEAGWKALQTDPASPFEKYAGNPVNAKWYYDLLYGRAGAYPAWAGSAGGPVNVFYFEAFDEPWKGADNGWGLWDVNRTARYGLCGLPGQAACNADIYQGAGYFQ
jgi:exo-beta-1,3-glucanase (GH17 family)